MSAPTTAVVIGLSLFSYGLMAVIAFVTAALIAALVAGLTRFGERAAAAASAKAVPAAAVVPAPQPIPADASGIDPAVVAAIAAAVNVVAGGHRIVWIGEAQPVGGWTGEVRQRHHGSHNPHHDR